MSVLVAGVIAIDNIETPVETRVNLLGGSAAYAALSAGFFAPVRLLGVVGRDFPEEHMELLKARGVDTSGVELGDGDTFRWTGRYHADMNTRDTVEIALNVFEGYSPTLSTKQRESKVVLLANMEPQLQIAVLDQLDASAIVIADSMDLWIARSRDTLLDLLKRVDLFVINDSEAQLFTGEDNLITAGRRLCEWGPKNVVIKKGGHGALLFGDGEFFSTVAYPLTEVADPTGAGDTFVGGIAGYLASLENEAPSFRDLSVAVVYGTIMASFTCQHFSTEGMKVLTHEAVEQRLKEFRDFTQF